MSNISVTLYSLALFSSLEHVTYDMYKYLVQDTIQELGYVQQLAFNIEDDLIAGETNV